ncbi:GTPase IMAP family member 6-like [Anabas testudineus]|uniref:GTPase IMAP family member 6-like n=1 Tax=Anabas testudineus TaxID=64144 RepID=UPI000E45B61C|nr:GTPase IMAP family member 6-like [Anabas testudineus]
MAVRAAEKQIQKDKQASGSMSQEEINKETWVKLTGPAAESLAEAFSGPDVVVVQETMGVCGGAEVPHVRGAEDGDPQVTGTNTTQTVSVSPTRIVMAGTDGAKKNIKVLKSYRIVLLGTTRAGKSSLANIIFGEDVFKINQSTTGRTSEYQAESKSVHGRRISVIDSPDFFDTEKPEEEMKHDMMRCITECAPGPHVFLIVFEVDKFMEQGHVMITKICQYFSDEAFKYSAVVFTHGEELPKGLKIEEFVKQNESLSALVKKCSGRCHFVYNNYWKNDKQGDRRSSQFQVAELLNTIHKIVMQNKGSCYSKKKLKAVKRETDEGNMPQGDVSKTAVNSVSRNVWFRLTGPAAESLAEAFFTPTIVVLQGGQQKGADVAKDDDSRETDEKDAKKIEEKTETEDEDIRTNN